MSKAPSPAHVTKKVTASVVTTPVAAVAPTARFEHMVQLSPNGDYEDEKVLIQGSTA